MSVKQARSIAENPPSEESIRAGRDDTFNRLFSGPLSLAARRQLSLRDAGYTGPIDQDGMPVRG